MEPLEVFHPDRLASRILGMGDVITLVEQAQEVIDEEAAQRLEEKVRQATFDLNDFLDQFSQIKKMGSLSQIMGMIPGMGKMVNSPEVQDALTEQNVARTEAIILSMTAQERSRPEVIDGSRRRRIAAGSGTQPRDVNQLLNQFKQMQKMMKMLSSGPDAELAGYGGNARPLKSAIRLGEAAGIQKKERPDSSGRSPALGAVVIRLEAGVPNRDSNSAAPGGRWRTGCEWRRRYAG